jgi:hypothetical protein
MTASEGTTVYSANLASLLTRSSHNAQVQTANALVIIPSRYVQIHPMMSIDGRYPDDFDMPMQLKSLVSLSEHQIDRILMHYDIFTDRSAYRGLYARTYASELESGLSHQDRNSKFAALLGFLGATRLGAAIRHASLSEHGEVSVPLDRSRRRR